MSLGKTSVEFKSIVWALIAVFTLSNSVYANPSVNVLQQVANQQSKILDISIPEKFGVIEDVHVGDQAKPTLVFIQDAHTNPSAQKNISSILNHLLDQHKINHVGVEAADTPIDPINLNFLPLPEINKQVLQQLVDKGELSGTEWFAYQTQGQTNVVGVDDRKLYQKNIKAYRDISKKAALYLPLLEPVKARIKELKKTYYDVKLRELEKQKEAAFNTSDQTIAYINTVSKLTKRMLSMDLSKSDAQARFPHLVRILKLQDSGKNVNMKKLKAEVEALKVVLSEKLLDSPEKEFILNNLGESQFPLGARHYFDKLYLATEGLSIDWKSYPQLTQFSSSLILKEELVGTQLFEELDSIENHIYQKLLIAEKAKKVFVQSEMIQLIENAFKLELTRKDLEELSRVLKETTLISLFEGLVQLNEDQEFKMNLLLNDVMEFYLLARSRDESFVSNLKQHTSDKQIKQMALVAGGFHSEGISSLLRASDWSYVIVSPNVSQFNPNQYRELMTKQKFDSLKPLARDTVDRARVSAGTYLDDPTSLLQFHLESIALGVHNTFNTVGDSVFPVISSGVNSRLKLNANLAAFDRIELEAARSHSSRVSESVFRVSGNGASRLVSIILETSPVTGEANVLYSGVASANSLGVAVAREQVLDQPIQLAINVGAPDYYQDLSQIQLVTQLSEPQVEEFRSVASNFPKNTNVNPYTLYNRDLISMLWALIGDPNISLNEIFGVANPQSLFNLVVSNTVFGRLPGKLLLIEEEGVFYLSINDKRIKLNPELPHNDNVDGYDTLIDMSDSRNSGESEENLLKRLEDLRSKSSLSSVISYNPLSDLKTKRPIIYGQNSEVLLREDEVHFVPSLGTQVAGNVLALLQRSDLNEDISAYTGLSVKTPAELMDRELQTLRAGMGTALSLEFPEWAGYNKTNDGELVQASLNSMNFAAPFKGASIVDFTIQLKADSELLKLNPEERKKKIIAALQAGLKRTGSENFVRLQKEGEPLESLMLSDHRELAIIGIEDMIVGGEGQVLIPVWSNELGRVQTFMNMLVNDRSNYPIETTSQDNVPSNSIPVVDSSDTKYMPAQLPEGERIYYGITGGRGRIGKGILRLLYKDPNYYPAFLNGVSDVIALVQQMQADIVHKAYPWVAEAVKEGPGKDFLVLKDKQTDEVVYKIPIFNIRLARSGNKEDAAAKFIRDMVTMLRGLKGPNEEAINIEVLFDAVGEDDGFNRPLHHSLAIAGVQRIIKTYPAKKDGIKNIVFGINHVEDIREEIERAHMAKEEYQRIIPTSAYGAIPEEVPLVVETISCASCTTNGVGPGLSRLNGYLLDEGFPSMFDAVFITEHGYTLSQSSLGSASRVPKKGPSLVNDPTMLGAISTTGASKAYVKADPLFKGKFEGASRRLANPDGSAVWTSLRIGINNINDVPTVEQVNAQAYSWANSDALRGIFGYDEIQNTSQLHNRSESSIFDPSGTSVTVSPDKDYVVIQIKEWYDNEMGYTHRVIDVEKYAALLSRGLIEDDTDYGPSVVSAVKLPGQPYLHTYNGDAEAIIKDQVVGKETIIASPNVTYIPLINLLKKQPPAFFTSEQKKYLKRMVDEFLVPVLQRARDLKQGFPSLYHKGRSFKSLQVTGIKDVMSFTSTEGHQYFMLPQYIADEGFLNINIPFSFVEKVVTTDDHHAYYQLILMGIFQEVMGLSYPEALVAAKHYNKEATQGVSDLPDMTRAMLDLMREQAKSDDEARDYLNGAMKDNVGFVFGETVRNSLVKRRAAPEYMNTIRNELTVMAHLINGYIAGPVVNGKGIPATPQELVSVLNADNLVSQNEIPTEVLSKASLSRDLVAAASMVPVVQRFRGVSLQKPLDDHLLTGLLDSTTTDQIKGLLGSRDLSVLPIATGGSVKDQSKLDPGHMIGSGKDDIARIIVNPLDKKRALLRSGEVDEPGAISSFIVFDEPEDSVNAPRAFPMLYGNAFFGSFKKGVSSEMKQRILEQLAENPIDPDADPIETIKFWAGVNGVVYNPTSNQPGQLSNVTVHVLDSVGDRQHETARINALEEFKQESGIEIDKIQHGTLEPALEAVWGNSDDRIHIFLSTSGIAEILTAMTLAGRESSYGSFRVMSRAGLENAQSIEPQFAYNFSRQESSKIGSFQRELAGEILPKRSKSPSTPKKIFDTIHNFNGNFEATLVPVTANPALNLPGIREINNREFVVPLVRIVRTSQTELHRWVEYFNVKVDSREGYSWTPIAAPQSEAGVEANSLGGAKINRVQQILLGEQSILDALASGDVSNLPGDYFLTPEQMIAAGNAFASSVYAEDSADALLAELNRVSENDVDSTDVLIRYLKDNPAGLLSSLFATSKPQLGVTVRQSSITSASEVVTGALANEGSLTVLVLDQLNQDLSRFTSEVAALDLPEEEKQSISDRIVFVEPREFSVEGIQDAIESILTSKFTDILGRKVTLTKLVNNLSQTLNVSAPSKGLNQHLVVLAEKELLPDADRLKGKQLISVERKALSDVQWDSYKLFAGALAGKLAVVGGFDKLPTDVRGALKKVRGNNVFTFSDQFMQLMSGLWNEFQGYQRIRESA